jgi:hypothetical protein
MEWPSLSEHRGALSEWTGGDGGVGRFFEPHRPAVSIPRGLIIAGLVTIGAAAVAWHFLGPDVRRYLKMHSM